MQAQLRDDELLLAYTIGVYYPSRVLIIRRNSATSASLEVEPKDAEILGIEAGPLKAHDLTTVLMDVDQGVLPVLSSPLNPRNVDKKLAALWRVLVPESQRQELTSGKTKMLTVIPDGSLALLPFETLIVSAADESDREYLLDVGPPIAYAPSAAVLLNLAKREKADAAAPQTLLTLGDPAYPQSGARHKVRSIANSALSAPPTNSARG